MTNVGGRPRTWDREKIADELVAWAMLDDSINLNAFCAIKLMPPSKISEFANEDKRFHEAYEIAKSYIAIHRENRLTDGTLHVKAYDLNARVYDYFLKQDHKEMLRLQAELKNQEQKPVSDDVNLALDAIMSQLSSRQSTSSDA